MRKQFYMTLSRKDAWWRIIHVVQHYGRQIQERMLRQLRVACWLKVPMKNAETGSNRQIV